MDARKIRVVVLSLVILFGFMSVMSWREAQVVSVGPGNFNQVFGLAPVVFGFFVVLVVGILVLLIGESYRR